MFAGAAAAARVPAVAQGTPPRQQRRPMTVAAAPASCSGSGGKPNKLFSFGLLSDVQYSDKEDGASFHGTPRYYRYALQQLDRAVDAMRAAGVTFALHLGDIVDYHNVLLPDCPDSGLPASEKALREVLQHFDRLGRPTLHLLGNHCLYNHDREELSARLGIRQLQQRQDGVWDAPHSYYTYRPAPGWRVICLDGYDVSILGWPSGHPLHEQARALLEANNPNEDKNSGKGLEGLQRRFVKFGGGVSAAQLAWLQQQLEAAAAASERVICCCHLCFHPDTCSPVCLMWNYDQVLEVLQRYAGTVVATLAGHAHMDGMATDEAGIRHRVCKAVLETPPGRECYGIVDVYPDAIHIRGVDTFASEHWPLPPLATAPAPGAAAAVQPQPVAARGVAVEA